VLTSPHLCRTTYFSIATLRLVAPWLATVLILMRAVFVCSSVAGLVDDVLFLRSTPVFEAVHIALLLALAVYSALNTPQARARARARSKAD